MLDRGVRFLKESGFRVHVGKRVLNSFGYLAGNDEDRLSDFNDALRNPDIRAIFCARGGYGSQRIIGDIDFEAAKADPKIIVGYSDITAVLLALWTHCGLVSFHGPLIGSLRASHWSYRQLLAQITGPRAPFRLPNAPAGSPISLLKSGKQVSGPIIGGCLSILSCLSGTPFQPDTNDAILFVEEIREAPYRIDRLLTHLKNAYWFEHAAALLCGDFINCTQRTEDSEPTLSINELINDIFRSDSFPILTNLPIGHGKHNFTIPIGCRFTISNSTIIQEEDGVC